MTTTTDSFEYLIRTQFAFSTDASALSCILDGIAERKINVNAFQQTKANNLYHVRLVIGSSESENTRDLYGVRKVLSSLKQKFTEKQVIQIIQLRAGRPGQINELFAALWCHVTVNSIYIGEKTNVYVDTSDIEQTISILSQEELELCEKDC
ncbi:hypothetical protein [Sutcliffiella halmapala]|uniref:hypothetical protein n=1 Tax=Sutcliffiella halmapala TaxID=79882 RepID=UPI0009951950|nr:hypothetical protein [Sutcliffiella halmapala]